MSKFEDSYQFQAKEGDIVKLPNGVVGIISSWDIICAGHVKEVNIYPFTNWLYRIILFFAGKLTYYDRDINKLQKIQDR